MPVFTHVYETRIQAAAARLTSDPEALLPEIRNAGAIFLGRYTPEVIGDYVAGSNHVLPTGRTARFASALRVDTASSTLQGRVERQADRKAFSEARATKGKPTCIVANTFMGRGVSFMEDDYRWHGKPPSADQAAEALKELA